MNHVVFLCLFYSNLYRKRINCGVVFLVAILDAILNMIILQLAKICKLQQSYNFPSRFDQNANKHSNNIHFQISVIDFLVLNLYLVDILDAI